MTTLRELAAHDLRAALDAAQGALADAAAAGRPPDEVWLLPPGVHDVGGPLDLGAPGVALTLRGRRTSLRVVPAGAAEPVVALAVRGRAVTVEGVTVSCAPVAGELTGVRLEASDRVTARELRVDGVRAGTATGVRVLAPRVELSGVRAGGVLAVAGTASGLVLTALDGPGDEDDGTLAARDLSVDGVRGPQARGVVVEAAAGSVAGVAVRSVEATADGGVDEPLLVPDDVALTGVAVHRTAGGADAAALVAWLAAAQARLAAAPAGTRETWTLPPGTFALDAGLAVGAAGRDLAVAGAAAADGGTELSFGAAAPVAGDLAGLTVTGGRVAVRDLAVRARAAGAVVAVRLTGSDAAVASGVRVLGARGDTASGLEAVAPEVGLDRVEARGIRATGTTATTVAFGVAAAGALVRANRVTVAGIEAPIATGLGVDASRRVDLAAVRAGEIGGGDAEAVHVRLVGPPGVHRELALLDVRAENVRSTGTAGGITLFCSGDVALRGVSVAGVEGTQADGLLAITGGELDWHGGSVTDVRGRTRGATGARLLVLPSRAPVTVRDVLVEAVRAPQVGPGAVPSPSWRAWLDRLQPWVEGSSPVPPAGAANDPAHVDEVTGLFICAPVDGGEPWLESGDPGAVLVTGCAVRRVTGTAVQVQAELRDVELRGVEAWTALRAGFADGERLLLAQDTWHRHRTGLELGACALTVADALFTAVVQGPGVVLGQDTVLDRALATFAVAAPPPFQPPPDGLYVVPGPAGIPPSMLTGALPPAVAVDLRLADPARHRLAIRVPGDADGAPVFLGALPPEVAAGCVLRDPEPPPPRAAEPALRPGPPVDYRARDARALLELMTDRARRTMPGWAPTGAADQTTMWLELLAARLDRIAYRQEVAVAEGYLGTAQSRRSVEDHARFVDHRADQGLSATAMVRCTLDAAGIAALGLSGQVTRTGAVVVPAGTLVVNPDATDRLVVFATEADLAVDPRLEELGLAEPVPAGATSAVLAGDHTSLARDRWLVLLGTDPEGGPPAPVDPDVAPHVVRVTRVELGSDTTRVFWDPRRPAPAAYRPGACVVLGNVVPAQHGLPLTALSAQGAAAVLETEDLLRPWRERLTVRLSGGGVREVPVPWQPVSVHAAGWPLPGRGPRHGVAQLRMSVDGEPWQLVDELATLGPADEAFALRPGHAGGQAAVVGDGVNAAALPDRQVSVEFGVRIGLGTIGNVAAGTLTRLLALGAGGDTDLLLGAGGADRFELVRRHLRVTNPVPATGGRDPEPLERIRYAAPLGVRDLLSAVVPADYERLVGASPEVAAARARVQTDAPRPVVRVTLLLDGEDALAAGGEAGEAERLRRWAAARATLESVRLLGFDVELVPPRFVPLDVDLVVDAAPWAGAGAVRAGVTAALGGDGGLLDPDSTGLGGDVRLDAVHRRVLGVPGVAAVRVHRLRRLTPHAADAAATGADGVLALGTDEVGVLRHPYGPDHPQGLLTVEVCGGTP